MLFHWCAVPFVVTSILEFLFFFDLNEYAIFFLIAASRAFTSISYFLSCYPVLHVLLVFFRVLGFSELKQLNFGVLRVWVHEIDSMPPRNLAAIQVERPLCAGRICLMACLAVFRE